MKHVIDKERIYLFCPCAHVCTVARFTRRVEEGALRTAIFSAVGQQQILCAHVVMAADGTAYIAEDTGAPEIRLQSYDCDPIQLILRQEHVPFQIEAGDTIHFFFREGETQTEITIVAHHLVCDGGSLMILMRNILLALNRQKIPYTPLHLLVPDDLPEHPGLALPMRLMALITNYRWRKGGRVFSFDDFAEMQKHYAETHENVLCVRELDGRTVETLRQMAHEHDITLNSLLSTAFAAGIASNETIGIAVDIRPQSLIGMGNYATAISVAASYDYAKSLADNAIAMHANIRRKLDSPKDKYFLYEFMSALTSTLIDSIYFARYGEYHNAVAEAVCRMCGYVDAPSGISLSNLKTIEMPDEPQLETRYAGLYFVPPYMPNSRANIGISTFGDTMTLTLHTQRNESADQQIASFYNACDKLLAAVQA